MACGLLDLLEVDVFSALIVYGFSVVDPAPGTSIPSSQLAIPSLFPERL